VVNSFSKYFSMPGWRLGWLVAPLDLVDAAYARMSNLFLTPVLAQHVGLPPSTRARSWRAISPPMRQPRIDAGRPARAGAGRIAPPDGAFYIWADIAI
jgi:aspartate/methionine/tyrosine aminotransferase